MSQGRALGQACADCQAVGVVGFPFGEDRLPERACQIAVLGPLLGAPPEQVLAGGFFSETVFQKSRPPWQEGHARERLDAQPV